MKKNSTHSLGYRLLTLFLAFLMVFSSFEFNGLIALAEGEGEAAAAVTVAEPAAAEAPAPAPAASAAEQAAPADNASAGESAPSGEESAAEQTAPAEEGDETPEQADGEEPQNENEEQEQNGETIVEAVPELLVYFYLRTGNNEDNYDLVPITVHYVRNGGVIDTPSAYFAPERTGYHITWYTDSARTNPFHAFWDARTVTMDSELHLYGRYEKDQPAGTVSPAPAVENGEEEEAAAETEEDEEADPAGEENEEAALFHTYNFFENDVLLASVEVRDGEELNAPALQTEPAEGEVFLGWYTEPTGGEAFTGFGAVEVLENRTQNLYARFGAAQVEEEEEEPSHTYYFFVGSNPGPITSVVVKEGDDFVAPEFTFSLEEGYEFKGWYTAPQSGQKFEGFGIQENVVAGETNLYAEVGFAEGAAPRAVVPGTEINVHYHTYKFNVDGSVIDANTQVVANGQKLSTPASPTKAGYKFVGWFTQASGGTEFTSFNTALTVNDTKDVVLYARFQQAYYVFFVDNNNKIVHTVEGVAGASVSTSAGSSFVNLSATQKLEGWYRDPGRTQSAGASVQLSNANITLYAKVVEGFWLNFESEGGTVIAPAFYSPSQNTVQPTAPTREGYTFAGWMTAANGNTAFTFGQRLTASTTIYAKWTPAQARYELIYWLENPEDENFTYEKTQVKSGLTGSPITVEASDYNVSQINAAYREFFTYKNHDQNKTVEANGTTKVNIYYSRNKYTFIFNLGNPSGGNTMTIGGQSYTVGGTRYQITAKYDQVIADVWPTAGHMTSTTFSSWRPTVNNQGFSWASKRYNVTPDMARSAGVVDAEYTIGNDLELRYMVESLDQTSGGSLPDRVNKYNLWLESHPLYFQRMNHASTSWSAKELLGFTRLSNSGELVPKSSTPATNDYWIYFYYSRNSYTLDFNNKGVVNSKSIKYERNIANEYYVPSKPASVPSDYVFDGWYTTANFLPGTKYEFANKKMPAHNLILYANWVPPIVNVKIHKTVEGTASPSIDSFTVPYGTAIPVERFTAAEAALQVPSGSTFTGWYFNQNAVRNPFNKQTKLTADIVLYPNIINNAQFTVSYSANGGNGSVTDSNKYAQGSHAYVQAATGITAPVNKVFLYWSLNQNGSGTKYYPGDKVLVTGNITLYAQYADKPMLTSLVYNYNHPGNSATSTVNNLGNNALVSVASFGSLGWSAPGGHTFIGWNTAANGSGAFYDAGNSVRVTTAGANVLYAQWAKPVTITTVGGSFVYDGNMKRGKVTVSNLSDGYTGSGMSNGQAVNFTPTPIQVTADTVTIRNAAGIDVTGRVQKNYVNDTLQITKRPVTLTSASANKVYDGIALTNATVTVGGSNFVGSQGATFNVTGSQTVVGESNNTFTYTLKPGTDANNYQITKVEGKLVVNPINTGLVVTVKGKTLSAKYDGATKSVNGFEVVSIKLNGQDTNLFTQNQVVLAQGATATASGKDAGEYKMGLTPAKFASSNPNFTNIQFVVTDGGVSISKRNLTLTSASANKVYDGTALTNSTVTPSGDNFVSGEGASYNVTGTQTTVGSSKNTFTYTFNNNTKAENYNVSKVEGDLRVTALSSGIVVTLKGKTLSNKYTGAAQTITGYDVVSITLNGQPTTLYKAADFGLKSGVNATATGTDAGTYNMNLTGNSFENKNSNFSGITFNVTDGKLVIGKRTVVMTSGSASKVYDGTPLVKNDVTVTGDGFVAGQGATYTYTGTQTTVGSSANNFDYALNSGTKAANYTITKTPGTLTVTQANAGITVVLKGKTSTVKYDGQEKVVTGYDVVSISNPLYTAADFGLKSGVNAEIRKTDAGSYTMGLTGASFENKNNNFSNITFQVTDGTLEIGKRNVTLTSASAEKTYDGTALTNSNVTVSGDGFVNGESATYNVTGTQTTVGQSQNTFTYALTAPTKAANYNITVVPGTLKVNQASGGIVVTLAGKTASQLYTGSEQSLNGYDVVSITKDGQATTLYKAEDFGLKAGVQALAKGTDAGSYSMGLTGNSFQNNNSNFSGIIFNVTDGKLTINKRTVTMTSGSASKVYDGTPLVKHDVTVSGDGFVNNQGASYTYTGTQTAVGSSKNTFAYTLNGGTKAENYTITKVEGDLNVTQLASGIVVTLKGKTNTAKYNGQNQSLEGFDVESITLNGTPTTLYTAADFALKSGVSARAQGKNAGTYNMGLTGASFENKNSNFSGITFNVTDGVLTIDKRTLTMTSASASKTYDGTALINKTVTVTGDGFVASEGADYNVTGSQTNAGSSQNEFTYTLKNGAIADNYVITKTLGTLTVNKLSGVVVNIVGNKKEVTYDGNEHVAEGYVATASSNLFKVDQDIQFTGTARAARTYFGTTNMNLAGNQFSNKNNNFENVTFNVTDGYVKINPMGSVTVTIKGKKQSFVYDGTEKTVTGYTPTTTNALYDVSSNIQFTGNATVKRTEVGKTAMGLTADMFRNTNTNYNNVIFVIEDGEIEITPLTGVVVNINGKKESFVYDGQPHSVNGYTPVSSSTLFVPSRDIQFTGAATATRTEVGESKMNLTSNQFTNKNPNFKDVRFVIDDGAVTITPNQSLVVTLAGKTKSAKYTGLEQSITGYDVVSIKLGGQDTTLFTASDVALATGAKAEAKGTNFGTYNMGLTAASFVNKNKNFGNVTFNVTDGKIDITKRDLVITSSDAEKMYDGTPLTKHEAKVTGDGFVGTQGATYNFTGSQTVVGSSANAFSYTLKSGTLADNYNITKLEGTLTVTELGNVKVTIKGNKETAVYDGNEHVATGYVATANTTLYNVNTDIHFTGNATARRTDVGKTNMNLAASMFSNTNTNFQNVEFIIEDGFVEITPLTGVKVKLAGKNASETYDGTEKSLVGYDVVSISNPLYTASDLSLAPGKEAKATGTDAGKYKMGLTGASFVNNNPNFKDVTFEIEDGTLTLNKRPLNLTSASDSKPYDGTPLTNNTVTATGFVAGQGATYTVTGTQTNVGTSKNNFTFTFAPDTKASNYEVEKVVGDLTVTAPAAGDVVVKIAGKTTNRSYNGAEQVLTGYDVVSITLNGQPTTLLTPAQIKLVAGAKAEAKGTNAGDYSMGLTGASFEHTNPNFGSVSFDVQDGKLTIDKRQVTMTSGSATRAFNNQPLVKHEVKVSGQGFVAGQGATYTYTGTITNVGTVPNTFDYALSANTLAANYDITKVEGTLEIKPVGKITVTIKGDSKTVTYDGNPHTVGGYVAKSNNPLFDPSRDIQYTGPADVTRTDNGKSNIGMTPNHFTNTNPNFPEVEFVVEDGSISINKRPVTLTSATDRKDYDGTPLTNHNVTVGGQGIVTGQTFDYNFTGSQTNVGTSNNSFTVSGGPGTNLDNYDIKIVPGKLTVLGARVVVTITGNNASHVYDGTEKTVQGFNAISDNASFDVNSDLVFTGNDLIKRTDAGKTMMGLKSSMFKSADPNYNNVKVVIAADGWLEITPLRGVAIHITGNNDTKVYNGRPHTVSGYTVVPGNPLVPVTAVSYKGNPSVTRTNAGTSNMNLDPNKFVSNNPNFADFVVTVTDGFVTVTPAPVVVTITGNGKEVEYDGKSHTVTGYKVVSDNPLYNNNNIVPNRPITTTGIEAGDYPMNLVPNDFSNNNPNFNVTINIGGDGNLHIRRANVVLSVKGNQVVVDYDAKSHKAEGYTVKSNNPAYNIASDLVFTGAARAERTLPGISYMNLTPAMFTNNSTNVNFNSVTIEVEDGFIQIKQAPVTVRITGAQGTFKFDGQLKTVAGVEMISDNPLYDPQKEVLFTGNAKVTRRTVGKTMMGLSKGQFSNLDPLFVVNFVLEDGFIEILESEIVENTFNVLGKITLAGPLADRDKPDSFESKVRNNWAYPFMNLTKVLIPADATHEVNGEEVQKNVTTIASIDTFFTSGTPTQDNVTTKEFINILKAAGIDAVTIPSPSSNLVSPEIYRESAELLRANGIAINAYEEEAKAYLGDGNYMKMFSVHSNEFTPEIARKIAASKETGTELAVVEVHWDEAAYRAEKAGENLSERALAAYVQSRKEEMAKAMIDAGAMVVMGYGTEDVRKYEEYMGGYIFYGLGDLLGKDENASGDGVIVRLKTVVKDGKAEITGFNFLPMALSSTKGSNDFQPFFYEKGSEGYWRIYKKLHGTLN